MPDRLIETLRALESSQPHDHCHLCGIRLRSLWTHAAGEHFFCRECYTAIVFPFVNLAVTNLVEAIGGNKDAQQDFAESFEPGSKSRVVIGFARVGEGTSRADGTLIVQTKLAGGTERDPSGDTGSEGEGGITQSEGQEAQPESRD